MDLPRVNSDIVPEQLEVTANYCRFRPANTVSIVESVESVTRAIAFCRDQKISKLLVDASGSKQLGPPTLEDRFWMVEGWAQASGGMVIVAMVSPPKLIHPQKFGVRVAADFGLKGDVFTSESEALAWLLAQPSGLSSEPDASSV
jgi:hypothetical protein